MSCTPSTRRSAIDTPVQLRSLEQVIEVLPMSERRFRTLFARLSRIRPLPPGAHVLDVGAASGAAIVACLRLGYVCEGVEPSEDARKQGGELARHLGVPFMIRPGRAEALPQADCSFDCVLAASVLEHVVDLDRAISEAYRVLKPGGVFWFSTASSLCPFQNEIRGFPLFGWYPQRLKERVMRWSASKKPILIAFTMAPAINWLTPWRARRLLTGHGFRRILDRWDLRLESEGGWAHAQVLRLIQSSTLTKVIADLCVSDCAYAALK